MVSSALILVAHLATAQSGSEFTPPPLVPSAQSNAPVAPPPPPPNAPPTPAPATPPPPADAPTSVSPGTPPPPSLAPGSPSPYGSPRPLTDEKPPVEWGLMVSEGLFGALTAAGVSLLPYFLLLKDFVETGRGGVFGNNFTVGAVIYVILFAAIPLSTAQTEVSIANGSRWYYSETWPAALIGLGTEAAVLGLAYLARGSAVSSPGPIANPWVLLVGTIGVMPLVQMAMINLFKTPRFGKPGSGGGFALFNVREQGGVTIGVPNLAPVFSADRGSGALTGAQFSILSGRF